jgi:hypothetical protein
MTIWVTYTQHLWMHLYRQLWRGAIVNFDQSSFEWTNFDCLGGLRYERTAHNAGNLRAI